jgi:ABC-type polysaccharide/polyol phosphate transport system ATPase subunit
MTPTARMKFSAVRAEIFFYRHHMLQINELTLSFSGQELLSDVSFNINSNERIGLLGRNGSGKTSLFKLMTGELHPDSGRIMIPKNYTIGYLKQHLSFTEPTLLQEACLGLKDEERAQVWKAEKMLSGLGFFRSRHGKIARGVFRRFSGAIKPGKSAPCRAAPSASRRTHKLP